MSLLTQNKNSLYGGVTQQPDDTRLVHQVDEMINFYPTVSLGLRLRNPSEPIKLIYQDGSPADITFPEAFHNAFIYGYSKGKATLRDDKYAYIITKDGGLEIIDMNFSVQYNGVDKRYETIAMVYKDGKGLSYSNQNAKAYVTDFVSENSYSMTSVKDAVFLTNKLRVPTVKTSVDAGSRDYRHLGYIWIKKNEPVYGWKYGATIFIKNVHSGDIVEINIPLGTAMTEGTDEIATDLANRITTDKRLTAKADGSVIEVRLASADYELDSIEALDSFGNTASFGWGHNVSYTTDLPNSMGSFRPTVAVGENEDSNIWLKFDGKKWNETRQPDLFHVIDEVTMPHVIKRVLKPNGVEFVVEQYEWEERLVGDDDTNSYPQFIGSPIKDVFFFKNRLGLMTKDGMSLSEVDKFGSFFRKSVATLLDSDRIDFSVEATNSVELEHAVPILDSVMLFSTQSQFRFKGGASLTPSNFEVRQEFNYEMNVDVRPFSMNNRIYFVAKRGLFSAVYEVYINDNTSIGSSATDLTQHCPHYVDGAVYNISGDSVNNTLFVISKANITSSDYDSPLTYNRNTIYGYKFTDDGNARIQSAWFKWQFRGDILGGICLSSTMYLLIDRVDSIDIDRWILSTGQWVMSDPWVNKGQWIMSPETLSHHKQLEQIEISPRALDNKFLDNYDTKIDARVDMGRWFYAGGANVPKTVNGILQLKTGKVISQGEFDFVVKYTDRDKTKVIPSRYIGNRRAMLYGRNETTELGLVSTGTKGLEVSTVLLEGNLIRRAKG